MREKEGDLTKNKPGSGWRCINCWGMFAYSISSACFCTSQTGYWSAVVRCGKYKLTCSSEKCPQKPLHSEEIVSLGFTVITSRSLWREGMVTFDFPNHFLQSLMTRFCHLWSAKCFALIHLQTEGRIQEAQFIVSSWQPAVKRCIVYLKNLRGQGDPF